MWQARLSMLAVLLITVHEEPFPSARRVGKRTSSKQVPYRSRGTERGWESLFVWQSYTFHSSFQIKLLLSMYRHHISSAFLCHVVFIWPDPPLQSSLKVPQPFARAAFIALGRRAADRLEERSCFLNILNHLLSVFWQHTFSAPLHHHGRNSKRHWERRSVSYSKCVCCSTAGRLPLFK